MTTYWRTSKGRIVEEIGRDIKCGSIWCLVVYCETGKESEHRIVALDPSLGPSNDAPAEVQLEIRAAALVAAYEDGEFDGMTTEESMSYLGYSNDENAGWLSKQIWLHSSIVADAGFDDRTAEVTIEGALATLGAEHEPPEGWEVKVLAADTLDGIDQSDPAQPVEASTDPDAEHTRPMELVDVGGES